MNFINEYALLFAVAAPVVAIVGMNAFLWLGGERGTLLLPRTNTYPAIEYAMKSTSSVPASSSPVAVTRAANDEMELEAA